jgi:hypothetical protein
MKISSSLISLVLKLVGGVLLISAILDYIFALIPSQWQDLNWQVKLINGFVDQGIVPLVGVCFIFIAWWIEDRDSNTKPSSELRISILTFTCVLGLFFLLLVPLHLGNVNQISDGLMTQINQQVAQQEAQIQSFVAQLEAISQDPEQLKQEIEQRNQVIQAEGALQGQQLNPQQLQLLRNQKEELQQLLDLSQKPEELKAKIAEVKTNLESELKTRETEEKKQARNLALQQSLKTSIQSFILAIAYTVIAWFGLKTMTTKVSS